MHNLAQERLVAYRRVSTQEQAESGAGLDAQRASIEGYAAVRGATVVAWLEDAGASGSSMAGRPGLAEALRLVSSGAADTLVVSRVDRLSRSLLDFAAVMDTARRGGWGIVALDIGVDTSTPSGEMVANVLASFAQFERRVISQRTKDALAARKRDGVRLGRPPMTPPDVIASIRSDRADGATFRAIADKLNETHVPTVRGGARWHASTVRALVKDEVRR